MAAQLVFDLPVATALGREDFFVAPPNAEAVRILAEPRRWPERKLLLVGPQGSGKTHLAGIWAAERGASVLDAGALPSGEPPPGAVVCEDVERAAGTRDAEERLFHLHNAVTARGGPLLMTAALPPQAAGFVLPDLASRLEATAQARLHPPDDALLERLIVKLFADRQIEVAPALVPWLARRIDRSFAAAREVVAALDAAALSRGGRVTRALAAEVLDIGRDGPA